MLSGFYSSGSGLVSQTIAMNHITNNITNALVPGYKKEEVVFHSFDEDLRNAVSKEHPLATSDIASGVNIIQGITDFSQGHLKHTGNNSDLAIEGDGFFKVDTGNGTFFTRNGTIRINSNNELVTKEGYKFLDQNGSNIFIDTTISNIANRIGISSEGDVYLLQNGKSGSPKTVFGKIHVANFTSPEKLERLGYGLWNNQENVAQIIESEGKIKQGFLEMANSSSVENMVEMIVNQRLYDANANMLKEMHKSLSSYINEILN